MTTKFSHSVYVILPSNRLENSVTALCWFHLQLLNNNFCVHILQKSGEFVHLHILLTNTMLAGSIFHLTKQQQGLVVFFNQRYGFIQVPVEHYPFM